MQNYTSKNRLNQKFGVKNYSENKTTVEVVGRLGINTDDARLALDVEGQATFSNNVGIGTTLPDNPVTVSNQRKLAVGIVSANEFYGDGRNVINVQNVAFASSLSRNGTGNLIYQGGNQETELLSQGNVSQVLISQGPGNPPTWGPAAPDGAVEGFLLFDDGLQVGLGTTFSALNFVGAAVTIEGTNLGGIATVIINRDFAEVAGVASESDTAINVKVESETLDTSNFIIFATQQNSDGLPLKTNSDLRFDAVSGIVSAPFFKGDGSQLTNLDIASVQFSTRAGFANSADSLTTSRSIFGIPFDGTEDIDASSNNLDVNGIIEEVDSITGRGGSFIIETKAGATDRSLTIRGNNNTGPNGVGGNVNIGDPGRGKIRFLSGFGTAFEFFKAGSSNVSGAFGFELLTNDREFVFQNKSGTVALLDDIINGNVNKAEKINVTRKGSNTGVSSFPITFVDKFNGAQSGVSTVYVNNKLNYHPQEGELVSTRFSGIGSNLTILDASNVGIGTLNTDRLPSDYIKTDNVRVRAAGTEGTASFVGGKNIFIRAGNDTDGIPPEPGQPEGTGTGGGLITFQGKRNVGAYRFESTVDSNKVGALNFDEVLTGITTDTTTIVAFKLPGNKRGLNNTFAMLDDITSGTSGIAQTAINLRTIASNNVTNTRYPILSSVVGGLDTKPIIDSQLRYNPSTDALTAGKFIGIGSDLTILDASNISIGKISVDRLPGVQNFPNGFFLNAVGNTSNLRFRCGKNFRIEAGKDNDGDDGGQLLFQGNRGQNSYKFYLPGQFPTHSNGGFFAALDCSKILNTQIAAGDTQGSVYFTLPGDKTGTGNTFAMLDDITNNVVSGSAEKLENAVTLNFDGDVDGSVTFDGETPTSPINVNISLQGTGNVGFATNSGTADTADSVNVQTFDGSSSSTNSIIFGSGSLSGNQILRRDPNFSYDTPSGTISVTKINATGIITASDFNSTSDIKLKTNIERISDPIDKILKIDGVSFNWIENNKPSLGVIADNIEEVLPELVSSGDPKTVNYNGLIGLLIEVVKEQQNEINLIRERLSELE